MLYRKLSATGDYVFGGSLKDFFINDPLAVAQAVETALRLWQGEWYLLLTDGTPYMQGVIGKHPVGTADATIKDRISQVQGVTNIENFSSVTNAETRGYSFTCTLNTIYGPTPIQVENFLFF